MTRSTWPYPGSRWWKIDLHTHTPASLDTAAWQAAVGTTNEITPEKWLIRWMLAGLDAVAITDHNTGAWIDPLKSAYSAMKASADAGSPPDGFRELTLLPGVEISVQGGWHLLAIFGPEATTETVTRLLGLVDYGGQSGDSDGVTRTGAAEVVRAVHEARGLAIPAHADQGKGLLQCEPGTRSSRLDPNTIRAVLAESDLLAMEWVDPDLQAPALYDEGGHRHARVLGSDSHSFQGSAVPGSRFTWFKAGALTLEGLRLALLDGDGVSVRRSDEERFEAYRTPGHFLKRLEIHEARVMGRGAAQVLDFSPYCNALIGGRGTGKSTVVHALRLALHRDGEVLDGLSEESSPHRDFRRFKQTAQGRSGEGALRDDTEIRLVYSRDGLDHRLTYKAADHSVRIEDLDEATGDWRLAGSQAFAAGRFPVRLFSQGQIAAMASDGRQALLTVIDEAEPKLPALKQGFEEARRGYLALRAQQRELQGRLAETPELERRRDELQRKLAAFEQSHHAEVLMAFQRAQRQGREIEGLLEALSDYARRIDGLDQALLLDDWPEGVFDATTDADALAWRGEAQGSLDETRRALQSAHESLHTATAKLQRDERLEAWRARAGAAGQAYEALKMALAAQGVEDPQEFGRLVQERQQLDVQHRQFQDLEQRLEDLRKKMETQWTLVLDRRAQISTQREAFLSTKLAANEFVRMEVVRFGYDERMLEKSLRDLLDASSHFASDIWNGQAGRSGAGLVSILAQGTDRDAALADIKQRLIGVDAGFGGHFHNHLQKKLSSQPEFADRIQCWFPEDDLKIEYSRGGGAGFSPIGQGSAGQRAAALLAFLLSFGDEPLILDQPEDDLDNQMIYDLVVRQIRENKLRRQLLTVTHNPNIVVNGDAELVLAFEYSRGQCLVRRDHSGSLQNTSVRKTVCDVMEGGHEAFARRWARLGREI
jgi:energy-coupling factor transporter ATP-binding protein EcfA2